MLARHAFRNSLFGLLTIVGLNLGTLIGGTVIIEQIFALPGHRPELLQAINTRNFPVVEAIVLVFAVVAVSRTSHRPALRRPRPEDPPWRPLTTHRTVEHAAPPPSRSGVAAP